MQDAALESARSHIDDMELLRQLNRGYVRAAEASDVNWYDQHLDPDYMSSNPDGSLVDRAGFLARIAPPYPGSDLEARDVRIRIIGELGIIQSGFRYRKPDGQWRSGCYTDVWSRRSGRWLCLSAHFALL